MSVKYMPNGGKTPEGEQLFKSDGWAIYRLVYDDMSRHLYACHVVCKGEAIKGELNEYINTSWISEDAPYPDLVGQRCFGCRCEVPEGIQALIHMEESHG